MTAFTESNTVEQMILDAAAKLGGDSHQARWTYASAVLRQPGQPPAIGHAPPGPHARGRGTEAA